MADELKFELDEPMREMLADLTGQDAITREEQKHLLKKATITTQFLNLMCITGFSTLYALARRGDRRASQYLIDRFMGQPDRPFAQEVQGMDALTSAKTLYRELRAAGQTAAEAQANVQRLASRALSTAGQTLRADDLED